MVANFHLESSPYLQLGNLEKYQGAAVIAWMQVPSLFKNIHSISQIDKVLN